MCQLSRGEICVANSASLGSYIKAKNLNSAWKHSWKMHIEWKVKVEGKQEKNWEIAMSHDFSKFCLEFEWHLNVQHLATGHFWPIIIPNLSGIHIPTVYLQNSLRFVLIEKLKYCFCDKFPAFAPICNPTECPWGHKAFTGYLGSIDAGKAYDATELIKTYDGPQAPILIDQVSLPVFLEWQLFHSSAKGFLLLYQIIVSKAI